MIQFFSVTLLYLKASDLADNQFLYIDVAVLVPLCFFQSWTGAAPELTTDLPSESLFSVPVLLSVLGLTTIQFSFQYYIYLGIKSHLGDEYVRCKPAESYLDDDPPCSDNTVIFMFTCMQYLTCCLCLSIGKPFRMPFYTNPLYLLSAISMAVYQTYQMLVQDSWSREVFALLSLPLGYRIWIFGMVLLNSTCSYLFENHWMRSFCRFWNVREKNKVT